MGDDIEPLVTYDTLETLRREPSKRYPKQPYAIGLAPNAGRQARLKAGAQRTLEAVACTPWFGWGCPLEPRGSAPHKSIPIPGLCSLMPIPQHGVEPLHRPIGSPRP